MTGRPGRLTYYRGDVATWVADEAGFDVVVSSRVLHHVPEPAVALDRIHRWLRPGGLFVCVDFLHDRFDRCDALWLAQMRGFPRPWVLPPDGLAPPALTPRPNASREWEQDHVVDQDLNDSPTSTSRWIGCS